MKSFKNRILCISVVIFTLGWFSSMAQQPIAQPGPNGIFVYFGKNIPLNFQYKLERKASEVEAKWEEIHRTIPLNLNYQVVVGKLLQAGSKNAAFTLPDSITVDRFIRLLRGKQTTDSVYIYNGQLSYIETMGTGYYDASAKPKTVYEYRISEIDKEGSPTKSTIIKADAFPGKTNFEKPVFKEYTSTSKSVVLNFTLNGKNTPANVRTFKQATLQTPFKEFFPDKFYNRGKDGLGVTLIDSMVVPGISYRYLVLPVDLLGNVGTPSDTVRVTFGQGAIAPLEKFEAKSEGNFIKLSWRSTMQKSMRSISIFRSENFDNGFTVLTRVPATDSTYTDQQITRGISYFYYLVFEGLTETSSPSAKVIGLVDEKEKPVLAPGSVTVEMTPLGNLVKWSRTEAGIKGYYVHRGEGYTATEIQISPLVLSDSLNVSFLDSIQNLVPGQTYCYAVSAVNRGNLEGPQSKVVIAEPVKPELPTPMNLYVQMYNDKAMLFWDDISSLSNFITGYRVLRSEGNRVKLDTLAIVGSSTYYDSTVVRGKTYSYSVQTVGVQQSESPHSASIDFNLAEVKPVPPSGLRATKTTDAVILHWDSPAVEGLKSFKVYREKLGETKKLLTTVGSDVIVFSDMLPEAGTYFYTVTSVNSIGDESQQSEEVGVKVE